jgi:hypothetical protein
MKRISDLLIIICLAVSLMASTPNKIEKSSIGPNQGPVIKSDTSDIRQKVKINPFYLNILPPSSGVQYYRDGIVFLSSTKSEGKMLPEHVSFGTIDSYYAVPGDSVPGNRTLFSTSAPFPFPCETFSFSNDYSTMYFSKYSINEGVEKIFKAISSPGNNTKGAWTINEQPLDFCTGKSTYSHPSLSLDGNLLIFASDRTGSQGGMDLFMTKKNGESWSSPANLGTIINTKSNELFPYLDSENNLYFSSDGLQGQGGYDIYVCKFKDGTWEKPINLQAPVNTKFDDVAFTVNRKDGKSAYYTEKQKSGNRSPHLYLVTINTNNPSEKNSTLAQLFTGTSLNDGKLSVTVSASPATQPASTEIKTETVKKETEVIKEVKSAEVSVKQEPTVPAGKKTSSQLTQVTATETAVKKPVTEPAAQVKPMESKVVAAKATTTETAGKNDAAVYRVQILSNTKAKGSYTITMNGKNYGTYEYLYGGGYRTCIGEFSTLRSAAELQGICRKSGYPQAFVVAFKNNVRSTDPALFK